MVWFRIDNRLIHGQIIETWLPYTRARRLLVCNAALAADPLRQQIMLLAIPARIAVEFLAPENLPANLASYDAKTDRVLVLFADCADARAAYQAGTRFDTLNIGNMHYAQGKRQICPHIALSEEDDVCLKRFATDGVTLDFRCVPNDIADIKDW